MEKKRLHLVFNMAPHYREAIYKRIDTTYDCEWYFSEAEGVKGMNPDKLKHYHLFTTKRLPAGAYWQKSILQLLFRKDCKCILMLAESRALSTYALLLLRSCLFPKKKIYFWSHGIYGKESRIEMYIKRWLFRHADGTFSYSHHARNLMIKEGIPSDRIFVIHNSLDYHQQLQIRRKLQPATIFEDHFGNNFPTLIFIGRLTAVKKLSLLLDAIAILHRRDTICNLVLVGNGEEEQQLRSQAEKLRLTGNIWFYGACYDEEENARLIYNSNICVSPGNVGLTAIHSMTFGTPVISHNNFRYQMPEFEAITEGKTGCFFEQGNVHSLADAIEGWLKILGNRREEVRQNCYREIDTQWTPDYQIEILKNNLAL